MTSGEGFIKAAGGEEIPNAGAEPQRSRQRFPAASCPRPPRRRDAVVPPPLRPGPALHRPGPRHRLGRPLGPSAPAVPAEIPGCRRREAGESPPPPDGAGTPLETPTAPLRSPASPPASPPLLPSIPPGRPPNFPTSDPSASPLRTPVPSVHSSPNLPDVPAPDPRPLAAAPGSPTDPWFPTRDWPWWLDGWGQDGETPSPQSVGDEELPTQRAQPLEKLPEASPGCRTEAAASMQQEGVFCHARGHPGLGGRRGKIPQ